ncbi:MAG: glycoside hydrolase 43 family protein, partial [Massilia sp.]
WVADNGNGTFTNPLFYDEFSDPDMIRVGDDYYFTGTTMHSMPGLPILHSKDLVNWTFLTYASPKLDFGPRFRLEDGKDVYGQGIWAPSFRYHKGKFYIFSNVNGENTQLFTATDPKGPWTHTTMKRNFHDLSVLFDDDGKVYVIWGYKGIRIVQLNDELTDAVPGTERELIPPSAGMGEGVHFYKLNGKYFITSAWFDGHMRMAAARADKLMGPYEVNKSISTEEDFGLAEGYRLEGKAAPFKVSPPNPASNGRMSLHQGGLVQTQGGEWWGFSMMDYNSLGRVTSLSPITWKDGWPYFGLPGNLERTPRTWVKPNTGAQQPIHAPYQRSDDFSAGKLQDVWQWSHVPVDDKWSLSERPGFLRLHALPAKTLWDARNSLTQRAMGPQSTPTVALDAGGMAAGDVAGLAVFSQPYAWIGVEKTATGLAIAQFDEQRGETVRTPVAASKLWLRADADFMTEKARFSYSTDGKTFVPFGAEFTMVFQLRTFQGVRYTLFNFNQAGAAGGYADFDSVDIHEPHPRGLMRPIPADKTITLNSHGGKGGLAFNGQARFKVVALPLGRVALQSGKQFVSVEGIDKVALKAGKPGLAESFQWIETPTGELVLMSLKTNRFLRIDPATGRTLADSPGPRPDNTDGVRFDWLEAGK